MIPIPGRKGDTLGDPPRDVVCYRRYVRINPYFPKISPDLFRKSQPFFSENQPLISKIIPTI